MTQKNIYTDFRTDLEWIDLFDSYVEERENRIQYMKCRNEVSKNKSSKNMYKESDEIRK